MSLDRYWSKRDFERTSEPRGERPWAERSRERRFVVQRHRARRLHYDFRLEIGGVLDSWAVPRGPSMRPLERRMAARTEDHPIEYLDFEGVIPAGEYGAGARFYNQGPFGPATPLQGYQLPLSPRELYTIGIAATDRYCEEKLGRRFAQLTPAQQDKILEGLAGIAQDEALQEFGVLPRR